jgi:mono/diheme cytochrome c family protein
MLSLTRFLRRGYSLAFAVVLLPRPGLAADAANGSRLAHRWCEACHVVAPTQSRSSVDAAPPFPTIAARPDFDTAKLALFLLDPHPKMPDMSLTRAEAADLAAYIGSLAK